MKWFGLILFVIFATTASVSAGEAVRVPVRVVAANLTSDNHPRYSTDNATHSNPAGAGARILKGLKPDIVLIQEFNTSIPVDQWVNVTMGRGFHWMREEGAEIPNGVISRFPIVESGQWEDPFVPNRDFAWAKILLPNGRFLWAISVHFYNKKSEGRVGESHEILKRIREKIPPEDLVLLGGDLNTHERDEPCMDVLSSVFVVDDPQPADPFGNENTNSTRTKPYDRILANHALHPCMVPVEIGGQSFPAGLVFDTRIHKPMEPFQPAKASDSATPQMQHMAVVRDYLIPALELPVPVAAPEAGASGLESKAGGEETAK